MVIMLIVVFHTYGWYSCKCVGTFPHFAHTLQLLTGNRYCTPIMGGQPGARSIDEVRIPRHDGGHLSLRQ